MGQQASKAEETARVDARLSEIVSEMDRARQLRNTLRMPAVEEKVAGLPAGPGSHRARYEAACHYLDQLADEAHAIHIYLMSRRKGGTLPMPDPTPRLTLPPLPEAAPQAMPEPAFAWAVQPGTPVGSAGSHTGQRGDSSSSEEGAQAGDVEGSEAAPLLAAGTALTAPAAFRRRRGHQECG